MRGVSKELIAHVEADNKFKVEQELNSIAFEINKDGEVEPVAVVEPVEPVVIVDDKVVPVAPDFNTLTVEPVAVVDFKTFMDLFMERQQSNPDYTNIVKSVLEEFGMASIADLMKNPSDALRVHNRLEELWQG